MSVTAIDGYGAHTDHHMIEPILFSHVHASESRKLNFNVARRIGQSPLPCLVSSQLPTLFAGEKTGVTPSA